MASVRRVLLPASPLPIQYRGSRCLGGAPGFLQLFPPQQQQEDAELPHPQVSMATQNSSPWGGGSQPGAPGFCLGVKGWGWGWAVCPPTSNG